MDNSNFYHALNSIWWAYREPPNSDNYVEQDSRSYKLNSCGHRGPEFSKNVDALIIGCSITHGVGLEVEETWGHMLCTKLGYSYNILSFPGGSIPKIVRQVFEYIDRYGKPKHIFALMPEPRRVDLYESMPDQTGLYLMGAETLRKKINDLDFVYTTPNKSNVIFDADYPALSSANALVILEKLCKFLDIHLLWTAWAEKGLVATYEAMPSYFSLQTKNGDKFIDDDSCHTPFGNNFYVASDNSHWGSHYHLHVAEDFYSRILEKDK